LHASGVQIDIAIECVLLLKEISTWPSVEAKWRGGAHQMLTARYDFDVSRKTHAIGTPDRRNVTAMVGQSGGG
jgi:hypothetical protein